MKVLKAIMFIVIAAGAIDIYGEITITNKTRSGYAKYVILPVLRTSQNYRLEYLKDCGDLTGRFYDIVCNRYIAIPFNQSLKFPETCYAFQVDDHTLQLNLKVNGIVNLKDQIQNFKFLSSLTPTDKNYRLIKIDDNHYEVVD